MSKLVFDIEADGLDPTRLHMIVAKNIENGQLYKFSDDDNLNGTISDGASFLQNATTLIGHNILGYDVPVVDRLCGTDLMDKHMHDTFLMSKVLKYVRPFTRGHGLKDWGLFLGNNKGDYDGGWDNYSKEMLRYCVQDVLVNVDVYDYLMTEFRKLHEKKALIAEGMKIEHSVAKFNAIANTQGWNFDEAKARKNLDYIQSEMDSSEKEIEPKLGKRIVLKDKEPKALKFTANGNYHSTTARIISEIVGFQVKPDDYEFLAIGSQIQRFDTQDIKLGHIKNVKEWLQNNGWKPDEWNVKNINGKWINQSPKLTSSSLLKVGRVGELLDNYYTLRNRSGIIEGWFTKSREGRIHGNMMTIGTPTSRCTHSTIVNLPSVGTAYGKEVRELLIADDGEVIVGADSSACELRALAHYVGNDDFTNEIIEGDIHQRNADSIGCTRQVAKTVLYGFMYGAGNGKLGESLTGKQNVNVGKKAREALLTSMKGLDVLQSRLVNTWKMNDGWFPALDGRIVFCPSEHQLLNYLLQSAGAITAKAAIMWAMDTIKAEGLRAKPRIFMHDEMAFSVHPDDAERVGGICRDAFTEAPKALDCMVMAGGDYIIGESYADVH